MSGFVYFLRAAISGAIKIGFTTGDPHLRLAALQTGNHELLEMVAVIVGDQTKERELHRRFEHHRIHGEWFCCEPDLQAFLDGVNAADPESRKSARPIDGVRFGECGLTEVSYDELEAIIFEVVSQREALRGERELVADWLEGADPGSDAYDEELRNAEADSHEHGEPH